VGRTATRTHRLTYEQALAYVTGLGRFGFKLGLERVQALLDVLGNPERGIRGAIVAGTNGKGSTSAFLESILRARDLRTGMMPSPHLKSYTERIQLDAEPISQADFAAGVEDLEPMVAEVTRLLGAPTEFELLTGLAIWWLSPRIDRLVVEVGMGGRLDATNVLDPGVAIITNVDLDHQRYLGETVEQIATEKAGIIKPGNVVVTGAGGGALRVIEERAAEVGAADVWRLGHEICCEGRWLGWEGSAVSVEGPGFSFSDLPVGLLGSWQPANAALAVAAACALGDADQAAVRQGLGAARWPGRLQPVGREVLLDGGHNPAGLRVLIPDVRRLAGDRAVAVVLGIMADKEIDPMLRELRALDPVAVVATAAASAGARAMTPELLVEAWGPGAEAMLPASAALDRARELAGEGGLTLVCGSLYLVGELLP
jgi:dihydrofolate synthase/folylpolyglutamate synthase